MDVQLTVSNIFTFIHKLKLYHWSTKSYARHKATDQLHKSLSELNDKFVETMIATYGRPTFDADFDLTLCQWSDDDAINELTSYRDCLINHIPFADTDVDLLNVRDEMVSDINQALYLFSFC